jgi:hypothetical protein
MQLYLDADITAGPFLAAILLQRGFDVVSAVESGNDDLGDQAQFNYAIAQQRVLLTFNIKDFVPLARALYEKGQEFPGLVVSPQIQGEQFHLLLRLVLNLLNHVDETAMRNTIRFLQEFR